MMVMKFVLGIRSAEIMNLSFGWHLSTLCKCHI